MATTQLEADYLVIGAGAVALAFVDVILNETNASVIIVDREHKPGGHWNHAYPFVTLHQPSAFYGVSSKELSKGLKDEVGLNKGLNELASGAEIKAYFDDVMREYFLPSGRVHYFPMCDYTGDGQFHNLLTGAQYSVTNYKKLVDTTYLKSAVPSTHTPNFTVHEGVKFMPLNNLPSVKHKPAGFVVIGGGKTGIDACLWLLEHKVDPDDITWIMPRDAWLLDRRNTQPSMEFFKYSLGAQANQVESIARSTSIEDMFLRLEETGVFLRIDQEVMPCMFHGATISQLELAELRRIKNVVRKGRVTDIFADKIVLQEGEIQTSSEHIHVDCSASALTNLTIKPIFEDKLITPQTVRSYQPVFSAAFIAHIEATYPDNETKNKLCQVVPLPNTDMDWIRLTAAFLMNQHIWSQYPEIREWLLNNRLDGFSQLVKSVSQDDHEKMAILMRMRESAKPAMAKLQQYLAQIG
ncbi:NAD(P)/FAD-dependent oxidoreductase [Glaciecola sp. KUL10]|uniref:NAD(P)/FAD-dependent oxidoreductase n=1 Tax=Glaciecola sp. (strain KUL10) TaxID=2161813 RepID=UPI000D7878CC|nr:NAD(P)/FAD-dependent oxidoreductase [Glaciecola sp. KUL10]GBL04583.1 hypothetical protein KUL10_18900 [Glaciecola sp. KUL10]